MTEHALSIEEIYNTYVTDGDRYIVAFVVGYDDHSIEAQLGRKPENPEEGLRTAADLALDLTRDGAQAETRWSVYDRETRNTRVFDQAEFDGATDEDGPTLDPATGEDLSRP